MRLLNQIILCITFVCYFNFSFGGNQYITETLKQQIEQSRISSPGSRDSILQNIDDTLEILEKDSALNIWYSLIEYCEEIDYYHGKANCLLNMAIRLNKESEYLESKQAFLESIKNFELINNKYGLALAHNGLGVLYQDLNIFEQSFNHFILSTELLREIDSFSIEGRIYLNIGGMFEEKDSVQKAKFYLNKSKFLLSEYDDTAGLISCYINLGETFLDDYYINSSINALDSAFFFFDKSLVFSQGQGDINDKFYTKFHMGKYYMEIKNIQEAKKLLEEAYDIIQDKNIANTIANEDKAYFTKYLSDLYKETGEIEKSLNLLTDFLQYNTEFKLKQSELEMMRIDFERLEKENEAERRRREIILFFSLSIICISILLIFTFYRNFKIKQKANRLLTEMDEMKTRLYSNITHELRTPLTLIIDPLEQMLSSETGKKPSRKQVKMMRKNANTVLNLINQMLDLSKIDAKSLKLELVKEDITKFIRVRLANFASLAKQKSIQYKYLLSDKKQYDFFDASKLEKIINNLVSNAIKFTPHNGQITCSAKFLKNNYLELVVQDNGRGIPKNELNIIFDRFHQVEETKTPSQLGTGIGLSLTKELVELMHGNIEVQSELGIGSKFTVTIPLGKDHLQSQEYVLVSGYDTDKKETVEATVYEETDDEEYQIQETLTDDSDGKPLVLIVEDHYDIREYIRENLTDNFAVILSDNGAEGLKNATDNIPDLIITDLVMPEMDGIELCSKLKTDERTSHIPVILLTAKTALKDKIKGLETGADAYLTKPFNIKELSLRVKKLIEQRRKLRERFTRNLKLEPKDIAVTSADEKFLNRALEVIEKNMGDTEFDVRKFQEEMFMSRMQLFRKIKALTNQTPGEFIRTIRLKRAARLIEQKFGNVAQITYEVGFNNPSHFAKCFKELFGVLPSEYNKNIS